MVISKRIHSLDALRAIMMILGLVLHSTEVYLVGSNPPWPEDNSTHISLNYLEHLIHMFRMPIFFIVAGFFSAMLFYTRGVRKMLLNRIKRIVFPFVIFLFILYPIVICSLSIGKDIVAKRQIDLSFLSVEFFYPDSTIHMWFLYYLAVCIFLALILRAICSKLGSLKSVLLKGFQWLLNGHISRVTFISIFTFVLLLVIWDLSPPTPLSFHLDLGSIIFYFSYFCFGWLLLISKDLIEKFQTHVWRHIGFALLIFTVEFVFYDSINDVIKGVMSAIVMALLISGIFGLFVKYMSFDSKRMRYISDSSYWVYLIHLPFTIIFPMFIANWEVSAIIKFLITLSATTIVSFGSYHLFVRYSFIGRFLNGKKYIRPSPSNLIRKIMRKCLYID